MKIRAERHTPRAELLELAGRCPGATFFHTPAWAESLAAAWPRFRPRWLTARENGRLLAFLPYVDIARGPFHSLQAMPFGTYGDPVGDEAACGALLDRFFRAAAGFNCLDAVVSFVDPFRGGDRPRVAGAVTRECSVVDLDGGIGDYLARLSGKKRQLRNRALREGIVARPLETVEEVAAFHRIYARCSRGWGGVHPYPERLFVELFRRRDEGVVFWGGFLANRLLGGNIDFYFGRTAQAWQAGHTAEAHEHDIATVLVVRAVEEAYRRGARIFNLGSSLGDEGLLFFKRSLGARECDYTVLARRKRWWTWIRPRGPAGTRASR